MFKGLLFSVLVLGSTVFSSVSLAADLVVNVTGVQAYKDNGQVVVFLYKSADGFPKSPDRAIKILKSRLQGKSQTQFKIEGLNPGQYGIMLIHDNNLNGKLDTNFFGIPKEGFGTSNNPALKPRAPTFEEAAFNLQNPERIIEIRMRYL
ncbi:MAG: DUF2141 domain-containing protein [Pseudobdellovibrionaceae bacterium]